VLKKSILALLAGALLSLVAGVLWLFAPLPLRVGPEGVVDVQVPAGAGARGVAQALVDGGVGQPAWVLHAALRLSGQSRRVQAGSYELAPGATPLSVLDKLVSGDQALRRVTLVEGWTYRQVVAALKEAPHLVFDLQGRSPQGVMALVGRPSQHPEGRFFPDTYVYPKGASASSVLKQAAQAMDKRLAEAWAQRANPTPLRHPDELLTLASIVEKETGAAADRSLVAGVFANRLRIGMRLQTDPTVIYGLGDAYSGRLRRKDLDTDTPYNTYTRAGLPPTPIAMPGVAALMAAAQPAQTPALYFVARGDGSSAFSATLPEHNRAVQRYILNR